MYYEIWARVADDQLRHLDTKDTCEEAEARADHFISRFSGDFLCYDPDTNRPLVPEIEIRKVTVVMKKRGWT